MKTIVLPHSGKAVRVPSTGDDWELYTSSMKCGRAATALTAGLVRALKTIDEYAQKGYAPTAEGAAKLYGQHIEPVMSKYADFGAADTEPRGVAYYAIENAVKTLTGRSIYIH